MAGWTNRGKRRIIGQWLRGETKPTNLYIFLATSAATPTADTKVKSELTEIAAGNGYTAGGIQLSFNDTDWDVISEDDNNNMASIQLKDVSWTASGGYLPASGNGARWAVITDNNATPANREVYFFFDLEFDRSVSDTQNLILEDCELRLNES
jgi:hypothetical protein